MSNTLTLSDIQARRTHLLYKKADYLTTPQEDNELEQLNKLLTEYEARRDLVAGFDV